MEFVSCDPSNYCAGRTRPVQYIVLHYTANNGDTARNNCDYYHRVGGLWASAHYFCDEYGVMQSVRECDTAWHCGAEAGRRYWHPACRNGNSIGIEMCSRKRADGSYCIKPETVANAAALAREIMQRYGIDTDHVLRHYDVTGKCCPMPWVDDPAQWAAFQAMLMPEHPNEEEEEPMTRYNKIDDIPAWARSDAQRLIDRGALRGNERGELDLSPDMLRTLIVCQRMVDQAKET
jgi:N-acetylmuramoyl-L-alanine amidase CwlA